MCGRYAVFRPPGEIARLFGTVDPVPEFAATWNMAPSRPAPVVRRHPQSGARHLDLLRWGLVPHGAPNPAAGPRPVNARGETVAVTPMFRDAFARRRCLVPADAFYEWQADRDGKTRLPHAVARADGAPMALAGLWEGWRGADGTVLRTFTIVTTDAAATLRPLHPRMPVVLEAADWPRWLGEADPAANDGLAALLRPSAATFRVWPVSTQVNNVRNDGIHLLDPTPAHV